MNRMKLFSNIIEESRERKNYDSISLLSSEINQYMQKVKALPKSVKDVLYITQKYNITSGETLQDILDAKRKDLEKKEKGSGKKERRLWPTSSVNLLWQAIR